MLGLGQGTHRPLLSRKGTSSSPAWPVVLGACYHYYVAHPMVWHCTTTCGGLGEAGTPACRHLGAPARVILMAPTALTLLCCPRMPLQEPATCIHYLSPFQQDAAANQDLNATSTQLNKHKLVVTGVSWSSTGQTIAASFGRCGQAASKRRSLLWAHGRAKKGACHGACGRVIVTSS